MAESARSFFSKMDRATQSLDPEVLEGRLSMGRIPLNSTAYSARVNLCSSFTLDIFFDSRKMVSAVHKLLHISFNH
jgi:hypothetical protein